MFPYLAENFRRSCQNCTLRVQVNIWWKIGFRLQSVTVFQKQLDFTEKSVGFWWKSSSRLSELLLTVRKIILNKNDSSKEFSFSYIFGTEGGNFFDQAERCLFTVDKTEFSLSGSQFWDSNPTMSIFLINFGISVWTFSKFSSKVSAHSSKMHFTCTDENLTKNWVSTRKCYSFS